MDIIAKNPYRYLGVYSNSPLIDQIKFAQYWWMNLTPLDGIAFNHLMNGNTDTAKTLWSKKAKEKLPICFPSNCDLSEK